MVAEGSAGMPGAGFLGESPSPEAEPPAAGWPPEGRGDERSGLLLLDHPLADDDGEAHLVGWHVVFRAIRNGLCSIPDGQGGRYVLLPAD